MTSYQKWTAEQRVNTTAPKRADWSDSNQCRQNNQYCLNQPEPTPFQDTSVPLIFKKKNIERQLRPKKNIALLLLTKNHRSPKNATLGVNVAEEGNVLGRQTGLWSTEVKVWGKAAWHWSGDSSVANGPFWAPGSIPSYECLPPAWDSASGDCLILRLLWNWYGIRAVPWLRSLVAGLSPRRPGFAPGSIRVGFVVDKVALGQVCLRVLRFSPVSISFHRRSPK
jgi:hypothetical protein